MKKVHGMINLGIGLYALSVV